MHPSACCLAVTVTRAACTWFCMAAALGRPNKLLATDHITAAAVLTAEGVSLHIYFPCQIGKGSTMLSTTGAFAPKAAVRSQEPVKGA